MARRHIASPLAVLFLLLLLILSTAARPCLAQPGNGTSSQQQSRRTAGGLTPKNAIVPWALIAAYLFIAFLCICCIKSFYPTRYSYYTPPAFQHQAAANVVFVNWEQRARTGAGLDWEVVVHPEQRARAGAGLDREVVESFPTAVYGEVKARVAANKSPLQCAVCLAAFQDQDELRVLPACRHVFHPDCIDAWFAGVATCPLCRADLTTVTAPCPPPASSEGSDDVLTAAVREETTDEERAEARLAVAAAPTPESVTSFGGTARPHEFHYQQTQSAMDDVPDRHTMRLPEHVMEELELAVVRRQRRAASLAGYPDGGAERTPGWLAPFWRSVSWQRPRRTDSDAANEHGGGNPVVPVAGAPDHDALNQV